MTAGHRTGPVVLVLACLLAAPTIARAADPVAQGIALRKAGDDQGALPLFQKAYDSTHAPRAAAQLGLCEQALGRWLEAETHLTEAMKAADDSWVRKNRAALDAALVVVKSHIARLEVTGEPADATILINGVQAGKLPLAEPLRVSAGEVEIELDAPGYKRTGRTIRVEGGASQRVAIRAEREPVAAPTAPPAQGATPATTPETSAPASAATAEPSEGAPAWRKPVRWVSLGLGAASLGVGVYGLLHNRSIVNNDFDPHCYRTNSGPSVPKDGTTMAGQCDEWKSQYETAAKIGLVGLIGAGVFTAIGVTLWVTDPAPSAVETALASCAVAPSARDLSLSCAFRF